MPQSRESDATIAIVDDDPSVREGLSSLIRSAGLQVEAFASAQEFLARPGAEAPSCLVLDLQLPGLSGLDLQKRMAEAGLVKKLPRQPGSRESRFAHLLSGDYVEEPASQPRAAAPSDRERLTALENEVAELKRAFEEFRGRFE